MAIELASKRFGKGLQVPKKGWNGASSFSKTISIFAATAPFFGDMGTGRQGKKKKSGKGLLLGANSPFNNIPLLGALL